jgi:RNA polymerase sigma-70 factor, ECF subfamily
MMNKEFELLLLKKLVDNDQKSFDALFIHYQPRLILFIAGFIKNSEDARDISQDIFYKIWTNRASLTHVASFKAYLFQMARNAVYDYYDHSLVKRKYENIQLEKSEMYDSIEEDIFVRELELALDMAVEGMPLQRKKIYLLSRKEGLSNDEIATQLSISKRTVENQITLALASLRKISKLVSLIFFT